MELFVLTSMALVFTIVMMLFFRVGKNIDNQRKRIEKLSGEHVEDVDEELAKPLFDRFIRPFLYSFLKGISKIFPKSKKDDSQKKLEKDLKLAGIKMNTSDFSAVRLILVLSFVGISLFPLLIREIAPEIKFLVFLAGTILAILIPRYYLKSRIKARQTRIRQNLPDMLDLLSVSVEAGLGFDSAILRVTSQSDNPLSDELITVYREIQMGKPRRKALKDLGSRSNVDELKIFISSVVQAEQLGISIKNVLRTQSSQLRISRKQHAEERAMKAPVKMMLPLVLFVFPVIFIILLGPSVMEIAGMMGG